jgi:DUF1009 family protein
LPVIGPRTVALAAAAGLSGIAVESGTVLIMGSSSVAAAADGAGLFVIALSRNDVTA